MDNIIEKITSLVENELEELKELFLVDVIKKGNNTSVGKVIILLDGDQGVSIDQCALISRKISNYVDEEIELAEPLTIEVSSAGLDHPLKLKRQYEKNIGRNIKTTLNNGDVIEGSLKSVEEKLISLEIFLDKKKKTTELKELNFNDINKTIVLVSFK